MTTKQNDMGSVLKNDAVRDMERELSAGQAKWQKASRSNTQGNQCVETAFLQQGVAVRDSKNPDGPKLLFTKGEWESFMHGAKAGEFDLA